MEALGQSRVRFSSGVQYPAWAWSELGGSGAHLVGVLNKPLQVPGLSFPALKSRTGLVSLTRGLGSLCCGQRKGRTLGTAWPTSEPLGWVCSARLRCGFFFQGAHIGLGAALHSLRAGNSDNGVSSTWKRWLASAWSVAHLEFPGLWAFLTLSAEFSSLLPPGTDRQEALLQPFRLLSSSQPRISSWHSRCRQDGN